MRTITLPKKTVDLASFVKRRAAADDCTTLVTDEFELYDEGTGRRVAVYCRPKGECARFEALRRACMETKFQETYRTDGLKTTSRIFGFNPRNVIRKDFCSVASLAHEQPTIHKAMMDGAILAAKYYAIYNQELYNEHLTTTREKIVQEYQFKDIPFTSGIINDNNPLAYHFDSGNFRSVWSAMVVLKDCIKGGHLAMPEYGIACEVSDKSLFFFDGQSILHGVTPITKNNKSSRRFSIVYYSLQSLWNCEPLRGEIARARIRRSLVENKRRAKPGYLS
jgi:hypothetical protein